MHWPTMGELSHSLQRRWGLAGKQHALVFHHCTVSVTATINGKCIGFTLFGVTLKATFLEKITLLTLSNHCELISELWTTYFLFIFCVQCPYLWCDVQAACQLSYVENDDNDRGSEDAEYLPMLSDDFQSFERETNEHATVEPDSAPVPIVLDDSQSLTEHYPVTETVATDRYFVL